MTDSNKTTNATLSEADDQLMDALLHEFADRGAEADEAFLTSVEALLDNGEHLAVTRSPSDETQAKRRFATPFSFAAGIAAGLALSFLATQLITQPNDTPSTTTTAQTLAPPPADPATIVAFPFTGAVPVGYETSYLFRGGDPGTDATLASVDLGIGVSYHNITSGAPIDDLANGPRTTGIYNWVEGEADFDIQRFGVRKPMLADATGISSRQHPQHGGVAPIEIGPSVTMVPDVAKRGIVRRQELVSKADEAALRADRLMKDNDYEGAVRELKKARDLLPNAPVVAERQSEYGDRFADASTLLARQRAEEGRYSEALSLVETALAPDVAPTNEGARRLLEDLNDPEIYTPALTPEHIAKVKRTEQALKVAESYSRLGDDDAAAQKYREVLNYDPYNSAARRGIEGKEEEKRDSYATASDHARAKALTQVDGPFINKPNEGNATGIGGERFAADSSDVRLLGRDLADPLAGRRNPEPTDRERYDELVDNTFLSPLNNPLSTFSIDVDTASYTNLRRMINDGSAIPKDSIRIEEMINYFDYNYPEPDGEHPFGLALEAAECPWAPNHQLLRVGIQGKSMNRDERPPANLVFLLDVSGSMNDSRKLPLVKQSISVLVEELGPEDVVSIVVYAGAEGLALPATVGDKHETILDALNRLGAGGSTNGGAGIKLAYKLARENFIKDGVNRVLLCTDGDFNVGTTGQGDLVELVTNEAKSDVFLSVLGFGTGNINDSMLEAITNDGNGTYYYVDTEKEARKVFLEDVMGTLVTIAKDVKIQVEFNPAKVQSYRLIGYANRMLEAEDFEDDTVDAGEIGAGHQVTALYEIVPTDVQLDAAATPRDEPELEFQRPAPQIIPSDKLAVLKLRYKRPDGDVSTEIRSAIQNVERQWQATSDDFQFASGVALFGMLLRESKFAGQGTFAEALELATEGTGVDPQGRRAELQQLLRDAMDRFMKKGAKVEDDDVYGGVSISVSF